MVTNRQSLLDLNRANKIIAAKDAEIARLDALMAGRDKFIVAAGLWGDFIDSLPTTALKEPSQ